MAIFKQVSRDELRREFTHYGLMYGLVPVYLGQLDTEGPLVAVRNWWPDWFLDAADMLYFGLCNLMAMLNPGWEGPGFMIKIGRPIEHDE